MFVLILLFSKLTIHVFLVKRVHWLRAQTQMTRWQEELLLVTYEMQWTVRYFLHQTTKWESALSHPNITPGASAYASRQKMKWHKLTC
ncbi:hypothetical protein JOM56_013494 [Amanita muscaria]